MIDSRTVRSLIAMTLAAVALSGNVQAKSKAKTNTAAVQQAPSGTPWGCELGNSLRLEGILARDEVLTMHWQGRSYKLPRQDTTTGADRFYDAASGMDLVVIPVKAMLFNRKQGQRLADECRTAEMVAGQPAQTRAVVLRASLEQRLEPQQSMATAPTRVQESLFQAPVDR